jgi:hypothetical protein
MATADVSLVLLNVNNAREKIFFVDRKDKKRYKFRLHVGYTA